MKQYLDLVEDVLTNGEMVKTRNGNRLTVVGRTLRFDLSKGFPAVTTKRLAWKQVCAELVWFLNGQTNIVDLHKYDCHIWDANAFEDGDLGPIYGAQWRNYDYMGEGIDQIAGALKMLWSDPASTRNLVTAWNPVDLPQMALPPCHYAFQLIVVNDALNMVVSMRSADVMVGIPFNIASYALLLHLFANRSALGLGELIMNFAHTHIYPEHIESATTQIMREPLPLPRLRITGQISDDLRNLEPEQFVLENYLYHPAIHYAMIA